MQVNISPVDPMQTYNLKKNFSIMVEGSRTLKGTTDEAPEDSVPGHGV